MTSHDVAWIALGAAAAGLLLGLLIPALMARRAGREVMRTADAAKIEREVRRVRAGAPPPVPQPSADVIPLRHRLIEAEARNAARADFSANRHRRANPYRRHTREFACWAIAYTALWAELENAAHPGQAA